MTSKSFVWVERGCWLRLKSIKLRFISTAEISMQKILLAHELVAKASTSTALLPLQRKILVRTGSPYCFKMCWCAVLQHYHSFLLWTDWRIFSSLFPPQKELNVDWKRMRSMKRTCQRCYNFQSKSLRNDSWNTDYCPCDDDISSFYEVYLTPWWKSSLHKIMNY